MATGNGFTPRDKQVIDGTIRAAEQLSRFEFSVYVGLVHGEPRAYATQLHNSLVAPSKSVLIMIDTEERVLEIVTGRAFRDRVSDEQVQQVADRMIELLTHHDAVAAITGAVARLAELAHAEPSAS